MVRFSVLMVAVSTACLAASCGSTLAAESDVKSDVKKSAPARVEATLDAKIKKVTLTPKAAERLGIEIDEVRVDPSGRRIVPYASVLYDLTGKTRVCISADPLTFVRGAVEIEALKAITCT